MTLTSEKFYIITPKAATNLVTNPSFELATTGWTAAGAGVSIAQSSTYARRGAYSCEITPASGVASGMYFALSLSAVQHSFSVDVRGVAGQAMRIYIADNSGNALATTTFTATGGWQRVSITYTITGAATYRLYVIRDAVASTSKIYVDGALCETGAVSTYFDGDFTGLTAHQDFGWNGTAHASTSYRLATTRAGGILVDISTYARVLGHIGLGRAPEEHIFSNINADGILYQDTHIAARDFSLLLSFAGNMAAMAQNRKALLGYMKLDATPIRQPMVIRYQGFDSSGNPATEPVDIPCVYMGGLEYSATEWNEKCAVQFRQAHPNYKLDGQSGASLGFGTTVSNVNYILKRGSDGVWQSSVGAGVNNQFTSIVKGIDGSIFAGGTFTTAGGVTVNYIAKWNGTAWSALGTGMNGSIRTLAVDAVGNLYAGGDFTTAGGTTVNRVAKWNGAAWSALGSGTNGGYVSSIAVDTAGNLYIGGQFTAVGGVSAANIAKWNGAAWSALGSGTNNDVYSIIFDIVGNLYAGGIFTTAGGTTVNYIAKWNGTVWSALGTGMNNYVKSLAIDSSGNLYAGGLFTTAGGTTVNYIAKWNGAAWSALGSGTNGSVDTIGIDVSGNLYIGGNFNTAGGNAFPDGAAELVNNTWIPIDIDISGVDYVFRLLVDGTDLYIAGSWSNLTATSGTVTAKNNTGTRAYPKVKFTGPGAAWQIKNYTNGDAIYFKNLTLLAGETAILDTDPTRFSFVSSFRGNLQSYILPGSTGFRLEPGSNNISAFMTGTTADSKCVMVWTPTYANLEDALL